MVFVHQLPGPRLTVGALNGGGADEEPHELPAHRGGDRCARVGEALGGAHRTWVDEGEERRCCGVNSWEMLRVDPEWFCHVVESPVAEAFMMKTINDLIELLIHVYYTVDRSSSRQSST